MKKIIVTVLLCVGVFFITQSTFAANYDVTCGASGCVPSSITGFFPASEVWYPGKTNTHTIQITNNSGSTQIVGASAFNIVPSAGDLDQAMHLTITRSDSSVAWTNSLYAFYQNGETTLLSSLANNVSETFTFTALMYQTAGNEYQNKQTVFDMYIGFIAQAPSPTPTPSTSCSASKPASPGGFSLQTLNNTDIKLTWNSVSDPYTGYKVSWGTNENADSGGGSQSLGKTTQLTISGLDLANKFYFFKVQAINDCNASDWTGGQTAGNGPQPTSTSPSSTITPTPSGGEGFAVVLGAATENATPTPTSIIAQTPNGQGQPVVLGATAQKCNCIWWQILLGELMVSALYFFLVAKDIKQRKHTVIGLGGIVLTFVLFRLLNKCLTFTYFIFANTPSLFCKYFIVADALILISLLLLKKYRQNTVPPVNPHT
ncbi:MAG: fibronectin type III domain-containing protein [bacterium]